MTERRIFFFPQPTKNKTKRCVGGPMVGAGRTFVHFKERKKKNKSIFIYFLYSVLLVLAIEVCIKKEICTLFFLLFSCFCFLFYFGLFLFFVWSQFLFCIF